MSFARYLIAGLSGAALYEFAVRPMLKGRERAELDTDEELAALDREIEELERLASGDDDEDDDFF